jgi:hypothetical protein
MPRKCVDIYREWLNNKHRVFVDMRERHQFEDTGIDVMTTIKWIFKKQDAGV